jgi:anaerobic selenocysteine-containing dehydrogenase
MKRRGLLKLVGMGAAILASGIKLSTPAEAIPEATAEGWTHPKHWDDPYNCPECGNNCDEGCCIASTPLQHVGVTGYYDWTETIQCSCGEKWDVDTGT